MRIGWKNDSKILQEYFRACVINWKAYNGPKPERVVTKLYGLYKQAVFGDCDELLLHEKHSLVGKKWAEWDRLKGMTKEQAKRRFITYLAEVDPLLIDVMPNEMPPEGFPVDSRGLQICAKCNSMVGCHRPLLDQHGAVLRRQLFEMEELHNVENLRDWIQNALTNQRCIWGVHKPVSRVQAREFTEWYSRDENRGYFMYDSTPVMMMVKDLLAFHYEIAYDMQSNKDEYTLDETNAQVTKTLALSRYYLELTGEAFVFEVPCTRDIEVCNLRRAADGGLNHKHPVELEPPAVDYSPYETAVRLRKQCQELGLDPRTGIQRDIEKRCEIYRQRIAEYYERVEKSEQARKRNETRALLHIQEKAKVKTMAADVMLKQMILACASNDVTKVLSLASRGCPTNVETPRGYRPLLCLMLNSSSGDQIDQLLSRGTDVNAVNRYGMSPLMLACRLKDVKLIHILMKNGADEVTSEGRRGLGRTPLHYCSIHGSEEEAKVITDYVLEGGEDALRVVRYLDFQDSNGDSPLMLAAKYRNGIMARLLLSLGANPSVRNSQKRNASYLARDNGHRLLADWLDTKVGAGVAKIETFSDMQFEKTQRYAGIQMKELVQQFSKKFLQLLQGRTTSSLLACPSRVQDYAVVHGAKGIKEQSQLTNRYYLFFLLGKMNSNSTTEVVTDLKNLVRDIVDLLRQGRVYPSAESPEKPLPWTPLMCACAANDTRSIRLIVHEGADPNYCNRHGTTGLMLSAQLNNVQAVVELLLLGADLHQTDNEGFTAIAYASSLPTPVALQRSTASVLFDGDIEATKRYTSEQVLKLADQYSPEEVRDIVMENFEKSSEESTKKEMSHMRILEKNGLTHIESFDDLLSQITGMKWRVEVDFTSDYTQAGEESSVDTGDIFGEEDEDTHLMDGGEGGSEKCDDNSHTVVDVRCPVCTLPVPCKHFFKVNSVQEYIEKKKSGKSAYQTQSKAEITGANKRNIGAKKSKMAKKVFEDMATAVLVEAGLDDRDTDRNTTFVKKYTAAGRMWDRSVEWGGNNNDRITSSNLTTMMPVNNTSDNVDDTEADVDNMGSETHGKSSDAICTDEVLTENETPTSDEDREVVVNIVKPDYIDSTVTCEHILEKSSGGQNGSADAFTDNCKGTGDVVGGNSDENVVSDVREYESVTEVEKGNVNNLPPVLLPPPEKSSMKKVIEGSERKKKYKKNLRVVKFTIDDDILDGGLDENDTSINISSYQDALTSPTPEDMIAGTTESRVAVVVPVDKNESIVEKEEHVVKTRRPSLALKDGTLTKNQEQIAMDSFAKGKLQPGAEDFTMRIGKNPVDVNHRRVHMFSYTTSKGGSTDSDEEQSNSAVSLSYAEPSPQSPSQTVSSGETSTALTVSTSRSIPSTSEQFQMHFSGWIFSGIYSLELSTKPIDTLHVNANSWAECLDYVNKIFREEWLPNYLLLETFVDTHTWAVVAHKCRACAVGIVRYRDNAEVEDHTLLGLCCTCMLRKRLYEKVILTIPRSSRKLYMMDWPFHIQSNDNSTKRNVETSLVMGDELDELMNQPKTEIQPKKPKIFIRRADSYNLMNILRANALAQKKASGDDDGSSVISESTLLSSVTAETLTTASSSPSDDVTKYGPRELSMIPVLLSNEAFDESERLFRICITRSEYGGDQGVLYLAKLMQLQAEMYMMQGLWVLALPLYIDSADIIITRLGFDCKESFRAFASVDACFVKLGCKSAAVSYFESLKGRVDKHVTNARKCELTTVLLSERRRRSVYKRHQKRMLSILHEAEATAPFRSIWRTKYFTWGYGALCRMMTSSTGSGIVSREYFTKFCETHDNEESGPYARFCCDCMKLRECTYDEVFKHLVHKICKTYLSSKTAGMNIAVAHLYDRDLDMEMKRKISSFLKLGSHINRDVFDTLLKSCLALLAPIFRKFVASHQGEFYRQNFLDAEAEFFHICTVTIQNKWRVISARKAVTMKRHNITTSSIEEPLACI